MNFHHEMTPSKHRLGHLVTAAASVAADADAPGSILQREDA
jgi:hypothetical protein